MGRSKYNSGKVLELEPKDATAPKRAAYIFRYPYGKEYTARVFAMNGEIVYVLRGYNSEELALEAIKRECYGLIKVIFRRPPSLKKADKIETALKETTESVVANDAN